MDPENTIVQISLFDWQEMKREIADLQERVRELECQAASKKQMVWLVTYRNKRGEVIGPVWEVPSKIKPARWAKRSLPDNDCHISYENTGLTPREYEEQPHKLAEIEHL